MVGGESKLAGESRLQERAELADEVLVVVRVLTTPTVGLSIHEDELRRARIEGLFSGFAADDLLALECVNCGYVPHDLVAELATVG